MKKRLFVAPLLVLALGGLVVGGGGLRPGGQFRQLYYHRLDCCHRDAQLP